MEAFYDLIRRVVEGFSEVSLDYVFTGALAASYYGVARTTVDVDIMVYVSGAGQQAKLISALRQAGLKVDERAVDKTLQSGYRIATFKDSKSAYNVDVIFSRERFKKRVGTVAGLSAFFQAPEDLILAKLRMIKATVPRTRALKDEEDVRAMLKFTKVDVEAVEKRARRDSTLSIFESVRDSS